MSGKKIIYSNDVKEKLKSGIGQLSNAVKSTMGPKGKNVLINDPFRPPQITKDGITVARSIVLEDEFENMGASFALNVSSKTQDQAGDGTTTATVLAESLYTEGLKYEGHGVNVSQLKKGMDIASDVVVKYLIENATDVDDKDTIIDIAKIASNNDDEIGTLIANAVDQVGNDGVITVQESQGSDDRIDLKEGIEYDRGMIHPMLASDSSRGVWAAERASVFVTTDTINNISEIKKMCEHASRDGIPLLLIANDYSDEVKKFLIINKSSGSINVCAIKAPQFGERRDDILQDLAAMINSKVFNREYEAYKDIDLTALGQVGKIEISKEKTIMIDYVSSKERVKDRIDSIKEEMASTRSAFEREKLNDRLSRLRGMVAQITIGANSEVELKEKKDRVDDALNATRAAMEEGVIPGGGVMLMRACKEIDKIDLSSHNDDVAIGIKIVRNAIELPIRTILGNADELTEVVINELMGRGPNETYNVLSGEYGDAYEMGVLDPVKVTRHALSNAVSVVGLLLTTNVMVGNEQLDDPVGMPTGPSGLPQAF